MSDLSQAQYRAAGYMERAAKIAEAEQEFKLAGDLREFAEVLRGRAHGVGTDGPDRD